MIESQLSVLYVEDDPKSRKVMEIFLKGRMKLTNVTLFENSSNFLERVETLQPPPDIIFLDIHVKPLTGFEMLALLRQHEGLKSVPVVALTASVMNEEVAALQNAGFDGCFSKPIDIAAFPENLNRVLGGERIWRIL